MGARAVSIVEVGPRDGFQAIDAFIPTPTKIDMIARLHAAGVRRVEATAFVSGKAVPQMADATEILSTSRGLPDMDVQVLTPNLRYAEKAVAAGADHIAYVLSVSEKHNLNNVRRLPANSAAEYATLTKAIGAQIKVRLNVATAFDCPFDGEVAADQTLALLEQLVAHRGDAEIALCDTTGRVTPDRVRRLFERAMDQFPMISRWAFHGHDTYGLGVANVLAAYDAGVRVFDASFAGLGGCPFAPGATGNVATEDVVWTFERMGVPTDIDLAGLLAVARDGAELPDACAGGRVRNAFLMAQARELR